MDLQKQKKFWYIRLNVSSCHKKGKYTLLFPSSSVLSIMTFTYSLRGCLKKWFMESSNGSVGTGLASLSGLMSSLSDRHLRAWESLALIMLMHSVMCMSY